MSEENKKKSKKDLEIEELEEEVAALKAEITEKDEKLNSYKVKNTIIAIALALVCIFAGCGGTLVVVDIKEDMEEATTKIVEEIDDDIDVDDEEDLDDDEDTDEEDLEDEEAGDGEEVDELDPRTPV